jgi:3-oxoacyl-[acyl-carrier protein] reductase
MTREIEAGPARLRIRISGAGPLLVLLPGLGRPAEDLDPFAERLVAAGYRVVQPDPRGRGGSHGPMEGLTLHDLARDVATVIEAVGGGKAVIIGHAFGNRIARAVATDRPDLVDIVVLLGCSGLVQPTDEIAEAIRLAQAVDTPRDIRERAVRTAWFGPGHDVSVWMEGWSQPVMRAYLAAAAATDTATWWTAGSAMVLIVQGANDVSAPPENGHLLKAQIGARATLVDLAGIGHAVPIEDPDAVAGVVLDFLAQRGRIQPANPFADLRGKVCLVTGSSRGIGAAVALGLGAVGVRVAVHYRTGAAEAEQVRDDIVAAGGDAIVVQGDVAEPGVVTRLIDETIAAFGRVDILINNAGDLIERRPVADTPDDLFTRHIELNLRPVFTACRAVVQRFRAQGGGGTIINLSSIAARTGGGGGSALYAGGKAFIATFSRALAKEVAADGIRVNCVSPGVLATPMQDRTTPPDALEGIRQQIPQKRIGAASEAVGAFLYLCSPALSGYVTGQVIEVNGGLLMP